MLNQLKSNENKFKYLLFVIAFICLVAVVEATYSIILFLLGAAILFAYYRKIEIGIIPVLLLIRSIMFYINGAVLGIDFSRLFDQERVTYISIVAYVYAKNFLSKDKKELNLMFSVLSLCIGAQIIYTTILCGGDKYYIGSIIGMSNYAATFLLMFITYFLFTDTNVFEKIIVVFDIIILLITQSFGGYIALGVVIVVFAILKLNWKSVKTYIIIGSVVLALGIVIGFIKITGIGSSVLDTFIKKIQQLFAGDIKDFSSSRTELYKFSINNILRHPVFGNIENYDPAFPPNYRWQNFRTHNIALESALLYGIVGTVLNIAIGFIVFRQTGKSFLKDKVKFACFMVVIATVIHGLIEPNFFTFNFSAFIWIFFAIMMRKKDGVAEFRKFKYVNPLNRLF